MNHTSNGLKVELTTSRPALVRSRDGDDGDQRGVLDEVDELTRERWQHPFEGLGQDDVAHGLGRGHAKASARFHLPLVNGADAGAHDLRHVGAGEDRERRHTSGESVEVQHGADKRNRR